MAAKEEITATYDPIDPIHQAALGEYADVSGAFYEGDFSLTLQEAQRRKHEFVLSSLGLRQGDRLLDIGCGWGPMLQAARQRGVRGSGITLSPTQVRRCRKNGLDASLMDWKELDPSTVEPFGGIVSQGAFEHFVSPGEMLDGLQEEIYRNFFRLCRSLLVEEGKLVLQTMTWGERVPAPEELDVHAPRMSDAWVLGHLSYLYPGSWLPTGLEQIVECAEPFFEPEYVSDGRADYVQTMYEWKRAVDALGLKKWLKVLPILLDSVFDRSAWHYLTALRYGCNRICFERKLFSHYRIVFRQS